MTSETQSEQIYVALLDDGVDVWRPVKAVRLRGAVFRIIQQPYDTTIERWEFEPGEEVICEYINSSDGKILAARRRV